MPPPSPGAVMSFVTFSWPGLCRVSIVTERLPWLRPAQYRLRPRCSGQRPMSTPPPGGSTRMTSAPIAASVAPPSGAATKADISTLRSLEPRGTARLFTEGLHELRERIYLHYMGEAPKTADDVEIGVRIEGTI